MESIVDKILTNNKLDLSATISRKSVKEILSGEAAGKSFDLKSHLKAAANVDTLFSNAIKKWDFELDPNKNNASLQDRTYLYAPMAKLPTSPIFLPMSTPIASSEYSRV